MNEGESGAKLEFLGVLYFYIGILWKYCVEQENHSEEDIVKDWILIISASLGTLIAYYCYL